MNTTPKRLTLVTMLAAVLAAGFTMQASNAPASAAHAVQPPTVVAATLLIRV